MVDAPYVPVVPQKINIFFLFCGEKERIKKKCSYSKNCTRIVQKKHIIQSVQKKGLQLLP